MKNWDDYVKCKDCNMVRDDIECADFQASDETTQDAEGCGFEPKEETTKEK